MTIQPRDSERGHGLASNSVSRLPPPTLSERAASCVAVVLGGLLAGLFDGLDVVHAAAIPSRAEPRAARRGDVIEQVRHRAVGSVLRDQFITTVGGSPIALAAANENGRALLVPQPVDGQSATAVAAS